MVAVLFVMVVASIDLYPFEAVVMVSLQMIAVADFLVYKPNEQCALLDPHIVAEHLLKCVNRSTVALNR